MAYGKISKKQKEILEFIKSEILNRGYPPAVREICEAVNLKSTSSVHSHLETLEKNGYIRRDPTKPRAIEIIDDQFQLTRREMVNVPIVGTVAAGQPILAEENIENGGAENSGSSVAPGDSSGYTRVITETGDTIYVKDTVTVYPDTSLRWIGNSAVVITEIASLNLDWLDLDGDDPSWVEVYNAGTVSANLKGWALVENLKEPKKWVIGDEVIAAKSFRTIFCSPHQLENGQEGRHYLPD